MGCLTSATLLDDGRTYRPHRPVALRAETEVVAELGGDIAAASTDREVRQAVTGVAVGLEIVDVGRPPDGVAGIVAGNVFHRAVAIGSRRALPGAALGRATMTVGDHVHDADEQPPDLVAVVRDIAWLLEACDERLAAGDRILTGSVVHVEVAPGDRLTAAIEGLGEVSVRIAPSESFRGTGF